MVCPEAFPTEALGHGTTQLLCRTGKNWCGWDGGTEGGVEMNEAGDSCTGEV